MGLGAGLRLGLSDTITTVLVRFRSAPAAAEAACGGRGALPPGADALLRAAWTEAVLIKKALFTATRYRRCFNWLATSRVRAT